MRISKLHSDLFSEALQNELGVQNIGSMAYVRCLTPEVVNEFAADLNFNVSGWNLYLVGDNPNKDRRTITADQAVELREGKGDPVLLLVDTDLAGAGMDGIYNAAMEVKEASLFGEAIRLAKREVTQTLSSQQTNYATRAVSQARGYRQRSSISKWDEFNFFAKIANEKVHPGNLLGAIGLWPVSKDESYDFSTLVTSRLFVEKLMSTEASGISLQGRIESLSLSEPSNEQTRQLVRFLRDSSTKSLGSALSELSENESLKSLWIGSLSIEGQSEHIEAIELVPWTTRAGKVAKWSGLADAIQEDAPPEFLLNHDHDNTGIYSKLEVRWKTKPVDISSGAVTYTVAIETGLDGEIASQQVVHTNKTYEKVRFTDDDFFMLNEDAVISAKIVVSVLDNEQVERKESEEFVIRFGIHNTGEPGGSIAQKIRCFSEGLIELNDRAAVSDLLSTSQIGKADSKNYLQLRSPQHGKSFQVYQPPLIRDIEERWIDQYPSALGRWKVQVRASGVPASDPEFVPFTNPQNNNSKELWSRLTRASQRFTAELSKHGGTVGQVFHDRDQSFDTTKEYILAWTAFLQESDPEFTLANTVEIQSLSEQTLGIIVLPSHPLRVAWHTAYDNLVFHARFEEQIQPKQIRDEFDNLDGAMFPAFLPMANGKGSLVFADTLGFHAIAMIPENDREPKATLAILTRAIGGNDSEESVPTIGQKSSTILGNEILKYLNCHQTGRSLHIHALRPGDGMTVARTLGHVQNQYVGQSDEDSDSLSPSFVLDLYPSHKQRGLAGRFISESRDKRRRGAGSISTEDIWMLQSTSLPNGASIPKLSWARKNNQNPQTAAHLAIAFDTLDSNVVPNDSENRSQPPFTYGLTSFFNREYTDSPMPLWRSSVLPPTEGEKHPSDRNHTDRLNRLQQLVHKKVAMSIGGNNSQPILNTEISPEKAEDLNQLHKLCDWVITLDRNAGIEYFDSPQQNSDVYRTYVIDTVPERDDLGSLQMITSTSNLLEVRSILDSGLDQMGLSRSLKNSEFLINNLKALSGRLAIRLTGRRTGVSELLGLAMSHANCTEEMKDSDCWTSLSEGFFVPVDDVLDLLPPFSHIKEDDEYNNSNVRPDLIYVSIVPRRGLTFQFIEVKYRRDLGAARSIELMNKVRKQVETLRRSWDSWYSGNDIPGSLLSIRRAKLARVLRFYAEKAHRHNLPKDKFSSLINEIDRMISRGQDYSFTSLENSDRGWIFCPDYAGTSPTPISPDNWDTRIFLFGPNLLPDGQAAELINPHPTTDKNPPTESNDNDNSNVQENHSAQGNTANQETLNDGDLSISIGTQLFTSSEIQWPLTVRGNPHLLLAGLPGMGKTTCLLNLCKQMLGVGVRPIVFSYHQDIDDGLSGISNSVRFIDFTGLGFNPLQVVDRSSRFGYLDVAGAMRDIFTAIYPELGDIQGERIRKAIKDSFTELGWDDLNADLSQLPEPQFRRFVEILRDDPKPDRGLRTLLARLEELDDYKFFDLAESQKSLWESDEPIVIRIHATQNDNLQKAFASLVFYGLYKDMFQRGIQQSITHAIIFDEAHRASRLQLIPTMAKECRKYGISLVLASQEAKDFDISLFSTIGNYLVLRLNETDAKALVRNVASSEHERKLVDNIKGMDRFKALYLCEGSKPSFVSLLPP